jgi:alpha-tubulin suppressor-like RCC1 family protein
LRRALLASAIALGACNAEIPEGQLECTTREQCPPDWFCWDDRCYSRDRDAGPPDAGPPDAGRRMDAGMDAGPPDSGSDAGPDVSLPDTGPPIDAGPPMAITLAAGDEHTCVLMNDGAVYCWGDNFSGQLGNDENTTEPTTSPVAVVGLPRDMVELEAGRATTCARSETEVYCWGSNRSPSDTPGAVGDPDIGTLSEVPVLVDVGAMPRAIAIGTDHGCAIVGEERNLSCWGSNASGQLGLGDRDSRDRPTLIADLSGVAQICAGESHTCALAEDGTLRCWGRNFEGQVGDGAAGFFADRVSPTLVELPFVRSIACGHHHTCAIAGETETDVYCWGRSDNGELGDTAEVAAVPLPRMIMAPEIDGATQLWAGGRSVIFHGAFSCGYTPGQLLCWGHDNFGQLGNGPGGAENQPIPTPVTGIDSANLATGGTHSCAIQGDWVRCWGANDRGQLGDSTTTDSHAAVDVTRIGG